MYKKEDVLEQLNHIESSLLDSEKFIPFNHKVLVMWGVISAVILLVFERVALYGVWYAIGLIGIVTIFGFMIEIYFTKKENIKYDIKRFTSLQKFVESNYTFTIIFATVLTYIFVSNSLAVYAYVSWIFLLGYGDFITGFVINDKKFTAIGLINMSVSIAIYSIIFIFGSDIIEPYIKYIAVIFVSGGLIYNGLNKRD
jgi:hypothetical protein